MGTTFSRIMKSDPYHEPAGSSKGGRFASKQTNGAEDPTETKEFKDWFGSSVVTDDKGKPKIVYHGDSGNATFKDKDFYTPAWFTDERELAAGYGKVTAYYLRLTNPKKYDDVDDMGDSTADNDGEIADDISGTVYMVKDASSIRSVPKRKSIAKLEIIRTLKIDPYHDKIGRFSSAPVSAEGWDAVQKNPVLKAGTKFIAYRVGTSPELKGVNGGNAFGIAAHLMNWMEEGEIKDENIYAHEVTLTKDTGEYEHIGFKGNSEENGTNPQVGRDQYFFGTGYSFPKDGAGFTSKLIKTIPVKDVLKEAEKDTDNAQRIATAIDKAFSNKKPLWDEKGNFSESLGIDCGDMPQIQSSDFAEFTEFAKTKGVTITPEQVPVSSLKPTQKHFNVEQAKQLPPDALAKAVTVSSDNYVLDGTNRWARNLELNPDGKAKINRMSIPVREALDLMFTFPKVFSKTLAQVGATQKADFIKIMKGAVSEIAL